MPLATTARHNPGGGAATHEVGRWPFMRCCAGLTLGGVGGLPSTLPRFLSVLRGSLLEFMVPPDHMPWFKQHWIESRRDDSATLKEEFLFLAELELLFGSLLFGAVLGAFYQIADDSMVTAFKDMDLANFGFWTGVVGSIAVILTIMMTGVAYLTIFTFMPIHPNNFYAFAKSDSVQKWLTFGTIMIVLSFYTLIVFLALATCNLLGGSWLVVGLTFGLAFVAIFPFFIVFSTNVLNTAMWSGAFGKRKVLSDAQAIAADARGSDDALVRRALDNIESFGKPIPCGALYQYGLDDDYDSGMSGEGGESDGEKHDHVLMGRRNQRQKMAAAALAFI